MTRIARIVTQCAFGAAVLGALGLGTTQALATPAPAPVVERGCNAIECLDLCGPEWICIHGQCHCGG